MTVHALNRINERYGNRFSIGDINTINYQLYSRKALQKRLWHLVIKGFRERNNRLLSNTALLYAKVFK